VGRATRVLIGLGVRHAALATVRAPSYPEGVVQPHEIELVFAPQEEGGYHVYAPDLPGLHTQGDTLDEANANAAEALELYVEGLREEGRPLDAGVIRRKFPVPA
jgi:predicted RNase H-like HicB family nuclease